MRKINLQSGFTIIELLLYMGVFSILLVILLQLFSSILSTHSESQATSSVDTDGAYIMARLAYDIHNSTDITFPLLAASPNNSCTATPASTTCHLSLVGVVTQYGLDSSGNLNITVGGIAFPVNSPETSLTTITFTTLGNPVDPQKDPNPKKSVQISFTLKSKTIRSGIGQQTQDFQTTVQTR
ncbi:MAG TPA: type II secretion system protein [Candidatus Eisenbacteria bacterium]|nr:type II secretion system protein [Candidatus Eisenbacteria bacterium]